MAPMFGLRTLRWILVVFTVITACRVEALEIQQSFWGFDGSVLPGHFCPLSLLVSNPSDHPFDGVLTCKEVAQRGLQRGAAYFQPLHLPGHASQWVQFLILYGNWPMDYELSWGDSSDARSTLKGSVEQNQPARVRMIAAPMPRPKSDDEIGAFPDALFPPTAAAADSLDAIILDHTPHWDAAQQEAALDWIKAGGVVHLLKDTDGEFPIFPKTLEALNVEESRSRIRSGMVVRHSIRSAQLTADYLLQEKFPPRTLKQNQNVTVYDLEETLFTRLALASRSKIAWGLISLLTIVYLGLVGPVPYVLRRKLDYRVSVLVLIGSVAVFGAAFAFIGRRGHHEIQSAHSLSIAQSLGDGKYDVTQWINAFATQGGLYPLTHLAPANLYAAPSNSEAIRARIFNGIGGQLLADIPIYSSIAFTHRAVMEGDDTSVTVEEWKSNNGELAALRLKTGPKFPKDVIEARFRYGANIWLLSVNGDVLELKPGAGQPVKDFLSDDNLREAAYQPHSPEETTTAPSDEDINALPLLYARALGMLGSSGRTLSERPMPADGGQLFVAARVPKGFRLQGKGFQQETGCVLYLQEVFKP